MGGRFSGLRDELDESAEDEPEDSTPADEEHSKGAERADGSESQAGSEGLDGTESTEGAESTERTDSPAKSDAEDESVAPDPLETPAFEFDKRGMQHSVYMRKQTWNGVNALFRTAEAALLTDGYDNIRASELHDALGELVREQLDPAELAETVKENRTANAERDD